MASYIVNSTNSQNFNLTFESQKIGELIYKKWFLFNAEIDIFKDKKFTLEPKGFWDSKIELKDENELLIEFKMGWKGILIKTFFNNKENEFLLKLNSLLSNKFVLLDVKNTELLVVDTNLKWNSFTYDYTIETTSTFDSFENKELLLLTILHCVNYYIHSIAIGV
jgi:hypothetical protein